MVCSPDKFWFNTVALSALIIAVFPLSKFWVTFKADIESTEGFEVPNPESTKYVILNWVLLISSGLASPASSNTAKYYWVC